MNNACLIERAKKFCEAHKFRFTEPREQVLLILANAHQPMGAYQILELLSEHRETINPPTVYRAIDFWLEYGFIHKIQSINAYIACCEHQHHKNFCIAICNNCHKVFELKINNIPLSMINLVKDKEFTATGLTTEIYGICVKCRE